MLTSDRKALRTGIPVIDAQHEAYADLVDSFFEMAQREHVDRKSLFKEMEKVIIYAIEHFEMEQHLMQLINYPRLEEHRAQHDIFRAETDRWVADLPSIKDMDAIVLTLSKWLIDWLCGHIQEDDIKLANFIQSGNWVI